MIVAHCFGLFNKEAHSGVLCKNKIFYDYFVAIPPSVETSCDQATNVKVNVGRSISLQATISGFYPSLTSITWKQKDIVLSNIDDRVTIINSCTLPTTSGPVQSTLQLSAVRPEDSGTYTVTATNKAGDHNSMTFTLTVKGNSYQALSLWQICNSG